MKTVGKRTATGGGIAEQGADVLTAAALRGTASLVPRGEDIDLLIDDSPDNVARVKTALSVLADNAAADVADTDVRN